MALLTRLGISALFLGSVLVNFQAKIDYNNVFCFSSDVIFFYTFFGNNRHYECDPKDSVPAAAPQLHQNEKFWLFWYLRFTSYTGTGQFLSLVHIYVCMCRLRGTDYCTDCILQPWICRQVSECVNICALCLESRYHFLVYVPRCSSVLKSVKMRYKRCIVKIWKLYRSVMKGK